MGEDEFLEFDEQRKSKILFDQILANKDSGKRPIKAKKKQSETNHRKSMGRSLNMIEYFSKSDRDFDKDK